MVCISTWTLKQGVILRGDLRSRYLSFSLHKTLSNAALHVLPAPVHSHGSIRRKWQQEEGHISSQMIKLRYCKGILEDSCSRHHLLASRPTKNTPTVPGTNRTPRSHDFSNRRIRCVCSCGAPLEKRFLQGQGEELRKRASCMPPFFGISLWRL